MANKKVTLDAGHGGKDPGAGGFGLKEKDVVLKLVLKTKNILEIQYKGIDVVLTRGNDTFVELSERSNISDKANADIFVSFHNNAAASASASGYETFVWNGGVGASTKRLQDLIHTENMKVLSKYGVKDRNQKQANYSVLRETNCEACLVEFLFISNEGDNKLLKNETVLNELAESTAKAIADYFGIKKEVKQEAPKAEEGKFYRLQFGAWSNKEYALAEQKRLEKLGIKTILKYN